MSFDDFFGRLLAALESARIDYMIVGSLASLTFGEVRQTRDVDLVIDVTAEDAIRLVRALPASDWYADEDAALDAVRRRKSFNIIDQLTFWKADLIVRPATEYDEMAFGRRRRRDVQGRAAWVSSPEDIVVAKLRWGAMSRSDRQLRDVAGVLRVQGDALDHEYIARWVAALRLTAVWAKAKGYVDGDSADADW